MFFGVLFSGGGKSNTSEAAQVRLATYNVYFGVNTPGSTEYLATRSVIQRVNPDIIAFQELLNSDYSNWVTLAADLGYPYLAYGASAGPLTGTQRLGFMSRYPIQSAFEMTEFPGATELTRYPLRVVIDIPGALNPLVVYTVHSKASSGSVNEFRRAIEGRRLLSNLVAYVESNPLDTEYVILGDFNQDVYASQTAEFSNLPSGLPAAYQLGSDVVFPVPYRLFPTDRFASGGLAPLNPFQEDSTDESTYSTGGRLDYLLFSQEIRNSPYGSPVGEIYNSVRDDGSGGLPKFGVPLAAGVSADASDHFLVFSDFHLIDALPCVNPVLLLSEIVSPVSSGARYIEVYNPGVQALSLTGYAIVVYFNGNSPVTIPLSGSLPGGSSHTLAANSSSYLSAYGTSPGQVDTNLLQLDGNDVVAILNPANQISDIYGVIGEPSGAGDFSSAWAFVTNSVYRIAGVSDPHPAWLSFEWASTSSASATPGIHTACDQAGIYYGTHQLNPLAPITGQTFKIAAEIGRNLPASNLMPVVHYRLNNGAYESVAMVFVTNLLWETAPIDAGAVAADVLDYYIATDFAGPGAIPIASPTNTYQFPHAFVPVGQTQPRFNEISADDTSTDDREFIELIAPAGLNLAGYFIIHYNGNESSDAIIWRCNLPSFTVPNDGITNINGVALGFCVITTNGNPLVANADLQIMPGSMQNGPDGLILYDSTSNIIDAVAWGGAGDLAFDNPGTVVTNGPTYANNFLHVTVLDTASDSTLQAPNNVIGDNGSGWQILTATPGAKNGNQTSGLIDIGSAPEVDSDGDGFPDSTDNCPDTFNPIQTDLDGDGVGDDCDEDLDGDGIPNVLDNCPATANPDQADLNLDNVGDVCDLDIDGDGIENDEDNCPEIINPGQSDLDGDGVGDTCDTDVDGDGIPDLTDNCPVLFNPGQEDQDGDLIGDMCDNDADGDGVPNELDNCPATANPLQEDANSNGIGDACDVDDDFDGVSDLIDNCVGIYNPQQIDGDADGLGDSCDDCNGTPGLTNLLNVGFEGGLPAGWSIFTTGRPDANWRFDDPVFRGNLTGATGKFAIAESSLFSQGSEMATQLRSQPLNLKNVTTATLSFRIAYNYRVGRSNEVADVDVSLNGASGPWLNVWRGTNQDVTGLIVADLGFAAGVTNAMVRFHYYNAYRELYWQVDDVSLQCVTCEPAPDMDDDGVGDAGDNCPTTPNADQADLDRDGIGDVCDPDRDGDSMLDLEENIADTDPANSNSVWKLNVIQISSPVQIVYQSSTGRYYTLQYSDRLVDGGWIDMEGQSALPGNGQIQMMTDTNQPAERYYRIHVSMP